MAIIAATVLAVAATVATSIAVTIIVAAVDIDAYAAELADATFFSCPKKFITQTN